VDLSVYNLLGQHVETLVNGAYPAGNYTARWDAGMGLASGIYIIRLTAISSNVSKNITQKVLLMK
jgi:hypothetical protein